MISFLPFQEQILQYSGKVLSIDVPKERIFKSDACFKIADAMLISICKKWFSGYQYNFEVEISKKSTLVFKPKTIVVQNQSIVMKSKQEYGNDT